VCKCTGFLCIIIDKLIMINNFVIVPYDFTSEAMQCVSEKGKEKAWEKRNIFSSLLKIVTELLLRTVFHSEYGLLCIAEWSLFIHLVCSFP